MCDYLQLNSALQCEELLPEQEQQRLNDLRQWFYLERIIRSVTGKLSHRVLCFTPPTRVMADAFQH